MAKKKSVKKQPDLEAEESRVTSLELFFDLVFLFWMYGGYVWLTNSVPPVTADRQLLLIAGMAAFLICALSIPNAFQDANLAFGIGYLIVIIVHSFMYVRAVGLKVARFVPMNFLAAGAIIAAGFAGGYARYFLWIAAI